MALTRAEISRRYRATIRNKQRVYSVRLAPALVEDVLVAGGFLELNKADNHGEVELALERLFGQFLAVDIDLDAAD